MMKLKRTRLWSMVPVVGLGLLVSILLSDRYASERAEGKVWISSTMAHSAESWWYDFKMKYRSVRPVAPVAIAAIDDASIERFGRWPWSRGVFAELVETLYEAGAKAVVFDVVFSEPEYQSRDLQKILQVPVPGRQQSIQRLLKLKDDQVRDLSAWIPEIGDQYLGQSIWNHADQTVLGYFWKPESQCSIINEAGLSTKDASALGYLNQQDWLNQVELILKYGFRLSSAQDFAKHSFDKRGLGPLQMCPTTNRGAVGSLARRQGFFNATADADGVFRRSNLVLPFMLSNGSHEGLYLFPSLSLSAVMADLKADMISLEWLNYSSLQAKSLRIVKDDRSWEIPVNSDGSFLIDFAPRVSSQKILPIVSLARAGNWTEEEKKSIRDKVVMIGSTSTGVYDLRPNPLDPQGAGVVLHAAATSQILEMVDSGGQYFGLRRISLAAQLALFWGFLLVLSASLVISQRALITGIWWPAIFVVALVDVQWFRAGLVSDFILIAMGWSLILALVTLLLYFLEERDRIFLKKAFAHYVSPHVVKQIEEDPKVLNLYGERKEISILFADIRGFTAVSELLNPDELRLLLSDYFRPMTEIIRAQMGTVDKFIGDAVMALFGAPVTLPQHPLAAVNAAKAMQEALRRLHSTDKRFEKLDINVGIAVASGWASVGNMGTESIFTYTAVGDVVNLASRLENLTKTYGVKILISESTYQALPQEEQGQWRALDRVRVVGRGLDVGIYDFCDDEFVKTQYAEAFELYQKRDWKAAAARFSAIADKDPASMCMARRCELATDASVDVDWRGVWNFDHK